MSSALVAKAYMLRSAPVPTKLLELLMMTGSIRYHPLDPLPEPSSHHYGTPYHGSFCRRIGRDSYGMVYTDHATPLDLIARATPELVLGSRPSSSSTGALVYYPSRSDGTLAVYPRPSDTLARLVYRWLTEPVPPVYLLALSGSLPNVRELEIPEHLLDGNGILGNVALSSSLTCLASLKLGDGTCRLDWLWNHSRFLNPINPAHPESTGRCDYAALLFADPAQPILCLYRVSPYSDERDTIPSYQQADLAAIVSTLAGYTSLSDPDLALLMATYWTAAVLEVAPYLKLSAARTTSALLLTDILARFHSFPADLIELLTRWKGWTQLRGAVFDWQDYGGYELPYATHANKRVLGELATVLKTVRLALAQVGIHVTGNDGYQQYMDMVTRSEALRCSSR